MKHQWSRQSVRDRRHSRRHPPPPPHANGRKLRPRRRSDLEAVHSLVLFHPVARTFTADRPALTRLHLRVWLHE